MGEPAEFPFYRAVREWAEARRAVTDSDWKKGECTPAMIQRLASAEMALVNLIGDVEK